MVVAVRRPRTGNGIMPSFQRKQNRLPRNSYVGRHWYFITVNAEDRHPVVGERRVVSLLLDTLRAACMKHMFDIYAYCFMPDHIHIEPVGLTPESDLIEFMRTWKGTSTVPLRVIGLNDPLQKGFYDHILRPDDNADAVAWYIFNNPVRKGLVNDARDWPHSGSWMFDWKKAVAPPEEFAPPGSGGSWSQES
jgi:putative transposase